MTCIVSYKSKGKVYIGGDSAESAGNFIAVRADKKVFKIKNILIGYAGSFRCAQLVKFSFVPPSHPKTMSSHAYMCSLFIPELQKVFEKHNIFPSDDKTVSELQLLIGYKGEVYLMDFDFNIGIPSDCYSSIGASNEVALGAMFVLNSQQNNLSPEEMITVALEASVKFTTSVKPPYTIMSI